MDKNDAVILGKRYVEKLKQNHINILDAWIFGSYTKGNYHKDSDIDIALVLPENSVSFDTDVRLMSMRTGEETMIEIHTYSQQDFLENIPVVGQIKKYGLRI